MTRRGKQLPTAEKFVSQHNFFELPRKTAKARKCKIIFRSATFLQHAFIFQQLTPPSHSISSTRWTNQTPLRAARMHGMVVGSSSYVRASGTPPKRGEGKAASPSYWSGGQTGPPNEGEEGGRKWACEGRDGEGRRLSLFQCTKADLDRHRRRPKTKMLF